VEAFRLLRGETGQLGPTGVAALHRLRHTICIVYTEQLRKISSKQLDDGGSDSRKSTLHKQSTKEGLEDVCGEFVFINNSCWVIGW
jgi:hypothetical protein